MYPSTSAGGLGSAGNWVTARLIPRPRSACRYDHRCATSVPLEGSLTAVATPTRVPSHGRQRARACSRETCKAFPLSLYVPTWHAPAHGLCLRPPLGLTLPRARRLASSRAGRTPHPCQASRPGFAGHKVSSCSHGSGLVKPRVSTKKKAKQGAKAADCIPWGKAKAWPWVNAGGFGSRAALRRAAGWRQGSAGVTQKAVRVGQESAWGSRGKEAGVGHAFALAVHAHCVPGVAIQKRGTGKEAWHRAWDRTTWGSKKGRGRGRSCSMGPGASQRLHRQPHPRPRAARVRRLCAWQRLGRGGVGCLQALHGRDCDVDVHAVRDRRHAVICVGAVVVLR